MSLTSAADPTEQNKDLVTSAYQALFFDFDRDTVKTKLTEDYIQHNPAVPTGLAPILEVLPALRESGLTPTVHRILAEDDLVALHVTYENADFFGAPTLVGFDIFRVENGKVAEHWDNLQAPPTMTVSGRSMTDGPTEPVDKDMTAANKAVVEDFVKDVFLAGQLDKAADYITSEPGAYKQHNPTVGDGLSALGAALVAKAQRGQGYTISKLHMTIAEGNFVLTVSEGKEGETATAFYDLWRLEAGLIVEHWDVISEIPSEMAHSNGKF